MRWPFVSRTAFDTLAAIHQHQTAMLDDLLARYHVLATPAPEPSAPQVPQFTAFPPLVAAALAKATASAPRDVRRAVYTKAQAMLDAGGSVEDVASAVLRGESVEIAD